MKHITTKRFTKIICTLGPASSTEEMLKKMAFRGMNVARINFSHGTHQEHQKSIDLLHKVNKKENLSTQILQDLTGYRLRVGKFKKEKFLNQNDIVYMSSEPFDGSPEHIPFDYEEDIKNIEKGDNMLIEDGNFHLRVMGHSGKRLKLKVLQGGILKERKGINIPNLKLQANIMTDKDSHDLEFGIKNNFDFVAHSFVRNKKDIVRVRDIVKAKLPLCKVIAKIENPEGVKNIDSIIDACDGIMVARGDLGVTMPIYKIPIIQKYIIQRCQRNKKLVITATQMLDSMIDNGRPTRAEVSDVANAILDGSDYVMLSGETSIGRYPSRCIQMMRQIIEYTESYQDLRPR